MPWSPQNHPAYYLFPPSIHLVQALPSAAGYKALLCWDVAVSWPMLNWFWCPQISDPRAPKYASKSMLPNWYSLMFSLAVQADFAKDSFRIEAPKSHISWIRKKKSCEVCTKNLSKHLAKKRHMCIYHMYKKQKVKTYHSLSLFNRSHIHCSAILQFSGQLWTF